MGNTGITTESRELIEELTEIVGSGHIETKSGKTRYYRSGFRSGLGSAAAVVFPGTLVEQWRCLQSCVDRNAVIIMQAAKTGLTEGSTPSGFDYDRPVVVINITRIKKIELLDDGRQALVLAGSTLNELETVLASIGRRPHSVIGSSSIGASVVGGIANNSGGALCKRGAAFTELALYARVNESGDLELVDELGIEGLGDTPEEILGRLEARPIDPQSVKRLDARASDRTYKDRIRDLDADVPSRFNADPTRLSGVSGSAGKVAAFAVRVDTFPEPKRKKVFFLGTNETDALTELRRKILTEFDDLPEMAEYLNGATFDCAQDYGKDVFLAIKHLGTKRLPKGYALKARAEELLNQVPVLPKYLPDRVLYLISRLAPQHLPERMIQFRERFEHLLILTATDEGIDELDSYLSQTWAETAGCDFFECNAEEAEAALLHRFAAAGAGLRYQTVHNKETEEVLALDVALLGTDPEWPGAVSGEIAEGLEVALMYGHFLCYVFHRDYIYKAGTDTEAKKAALLRDLEQAGAKYPAEHNVGHLYKAEPTLREFYEELDPTNTFNPGIGKTTKARRPLC